jgi:hypothetical protein
MGNWVRIERPVNEERVNERAVETGEGDASEFSLSSVLFQHEIKIHWAIFLGQTKRKTKSESFCESSMFGIYVDTGAVLFFAV